MERNRMTKNNGIKIEMSNNNSLLYYSNPLNNEEYQKQ